MKKMNLGLRGATLLSIITLSCLGMSAKAAQVNLTAADNNLYNTGVEIDDTTPIPGDPNGTNNPADGNWTVGYYFNGKAVSATPPAVLTPAFYGMPSLSGAAYVAGPVQKPGFPGSNWAPNLPDSQWITYSPNFEHVVTDSSNTSVTVYQLVLTDIPTGDQVTLNTQLASDDNVTVYANGQQLFSNYTVGENGSNNKSNYTEFTTVDGLTFVSGTTNTLDFVVYNTGGYITGLNAKLTGFYTTAAVPEPSTYALLFVGMGVLFFMARRKAVLA
jgi:hypothetical protein